MFNIGKEDFNSLIENRDLYEIKLKEYIVEKLELKKLFKNLDGFDVNEKDKLEGIYCSISEDSIEITIDLHEEGLYYDIDTFKEKLIEKINILNKDLGYKQALLNINDIEDRYIFGFVKIEFFREYKLYSSDIIYI